MKLVTLVGYSNRVYRESLFNVHDPFTRLLYFFFVWFISLLGVASWVLWEAGELGSSELALIVASHFLALDIGITFFSFLRAKGYFRFGHLCVVTDFILGVSGEPMVFGAAGALFVVCFFFLDMISRIDDMELEGAWRPQVFRWPVKEEHDEGAA